MSLLSLADSACEVHSIDNESNQYILSLARVLSAFAYYSWPHPKKTFNRSCTYSIGYCQSLNMIAGLLILVFSSKSEYIREQFEQSNQNTVNDIENSVFWTLVAIVELLHPPEMYGTSLEGSRVQQEILWHKLMHENEHFAGSTRISEWLRRIESEANRGYHNRRRKTAHLDELEMHVRKVSSGPTLGMVTTPWFLTLFVEMAPIEASKSAYHRRYSEFGIASFIKERRSYSKSLYQLLISTRKSSWHARM